MAKQSGIHQLRGKVGEHSYYRQSGIVPGLMRSINQGMSDRVKTAEEYANTRLNNVEFGAAGNVAGLLGQMIVPKFRPMVLPFSQSKMAKDILKVAREHTQNWGQRVVTSEDTQKLCDILTATSKRNASEFVTNEIHRTSLTGAEVVTEFTQDQATLMSSLGINGLSVSVRQFDLATGQWSPAGGIMTTGYMYLRESVYTYDNGNVTSGVEGDSVEDMAVSDFAPEANHSGHQIVVFVVMPLRRINNVPHVLQEYCSFVAMPLPAYVP